MDPDVHEQLSELEVFLRVLARMPSDEFKDRKMEISEAITIFADVLDDFLLKNQPAPGG